MVETSEGYFDLTLMRNGVILIVECKAEDGTLTNDQKAWAGEGRAAEAANPNVALFRMASKRLADNRGYATLTEFADSSPAIGGK